MLIRAREVLSVPIRDRIEEWQRYMDQGFRERRSVLMLCRTRLLAHRAVESSFGTARNHLRDLPHLQCDLCSTSVHIEMVASIPRQVLLGARNWTEERNHPGVFC